MPARLTELWAAGALERIQEKWAPVFRPNARQNKDLEHVSDSIFCQRALWMQLHWIKDFVGRATQPATPRRKFDFPNDETSPRRCPAEN